MRKRPTLATVHPDIAAWWHPENNGDRTPADVSPSWRKKVWWHCANGHAYVETVHARIRGAACPLCADDNTSAPEQWLYAAVRCHYPDVRHRWQLPIKGGPVEVDLYLPSHRIAIEYDGPHHKRRFKADQKKNFLLTRAGIQLVRIREATLPPLESENVHVIVHDGTAGAGLESCLEELLNWILNSNRT